MKGKIASSITFVGCVPVEEILNHFRVVHVHQLHIRRIQRDVVKTEEKVPGFCKMRRNSFKFSLTNHRHGWSNWPAGIRPRSFVRPDGCSPTMSGRIRRALTRRRRAFHQLQKMNVLILIVIGNNDYGKAKPGHPRIQSKKNHSFFIVFRLFIINLISIFEKTFKEVFNIA